jgi:hypothetical protein
VALKDRVIWHLILEVTLFEVGGLFLELPERIEAAFLETKLTIPNKTSWTIPLVLRFGLQRRVQTGSVVGVIAGFA